MQYTQMLNTNWILNNFSLYQGTDDGISAMYLHDGLDFMLPDGTAVYAVRTGTIRDINNGGGIITVDDPAKPDTGWQMGHLDVDPRLNVNDVVRQGQYVGVVRASNEHTHFNSMRRATDGSWGSSTFSLYPNDLFDLKDELPPKFDSDLRFYQNASDTVLDKVGGVSGKVDLVVAAHDMVPNLPNNFQGRSAPAKFELSILNQQGQEVWKHQSDLRNVILTPPFLGDTNKAKQEVKLLFKVPNLVELNSWSQKQKSWWIVTNLPNHDSPRVIAETDEDMSWDTTKKDSQGNFVFPNASYVIKVIATDSNGNLSKIEESVTVKN
jgi:murein DD-endopeptidase MepM/ murein hydrolase activator NlpD